MKKNCRGRLTNNPALEQKGQTEMLGDRRARKTAKRDELITEMRCNASRIEARRVDRSDTCIRRMANPFCAEFQRKRLNEHTLRNRARSRLHFSCPRGRSGRRTKIFTPNTKAAKNRRPRQRRAEMGRSLSARPGQESSARPPGSAWRATSQQDRRGGGGPRRDFGHVGGRGSEARTPRSRTVPDVDVQFRPDDHGVDSLPRQIKMTGRAYPLFGSRRLFWERPERYNAIFSGEQKPTVAVVQPLFVCAPDDTLWLSEDEAVAYALGGRTLPTPSTRRGARDRAAGKALTPSSRSAA